MGIYFLEKSFPFPFWKLIPLGSEVENLLEELGKPLILVLILFLILIS